MLQVLCHMALMPGDQNRFDAREVLVQRGSPDTRLVGDLDHGHRSQAVPRDESGGGVEDRIANPTPMRLDGVVPELWNVTSIRHAQAAHTLYWL